MDEFATELRELIGRFQNEALSDDDIASVLKAEVDRLQGSAQDEAKPERGA